MKICQFWGREFMPLSQKYEKRVRKFSFLARHHFKAELYCYTYIVIFGKQLSELYWIVLMFLDPQSIVNVSQEDSQHKILNWSILLPLFSLHKSRAGKREHKLWELTINSETAVYMFYIKNIFSENFGKFQRKH